MNPVTELGLCLCNEIIVMSDLSLVTSFPPYTILHEVDLMYK